MAFLPGFKQRPVLRREVTAPPVAVLLQRGLRTRQWQSDDSGWVITLSDLTLLLLCFLVLWYVNEKHNKAIAPAAPLTVYTEPKEPAIAQNQTGLSHDEWTSLRNEIDSHLSELGLSKEVRTEATPNEILISLEDKVPFDSGKADLRPNVLPVLEKVATVALRYPMLLLRINGHTDNIPISTSEFPSNWELSAARASRVARYIIETGVDPSRIAVQGYAFHRPRVPNSDSANRSANRRVEIRLYQTADQEEATNNNEPEHTQVDPLP